MGWNYNVFPLFDSRQSNTNLQNIETLAFVCEFQWYLQGFFQLNFLYNCKPILDYLMTLIVGCAFKITMC